MLTGTGQPLSAMLDNLAKDVLADTGGKVKITVYHNAQLASTSNVVSELRAKAVDISIASENLWIGAIPGFDVLTLPGVMTTWKQAAAISKSSQINSYLNEQTKKLGVTIIGNPPNSWHDLWTTKKINSISDVKGLKIRTAGGYEAQVLKALGASPVTLNQSELYQALLTHTVDGNTQSSTGALSEKLYEVAKYGAIVNLGMPFIPLCITNAALAKLSPDEQKILKADGKKVSEQLIPVLEKADTDAQKQLQGHGVTLTHPDLKPFQDALTPLVKKYAAASPVATKLYQMASGVLQNVK